MKLFAQIRKVDEAQRLVYGRAAQEVVDKADEVMDYESSKPNFQKWSEDIAKDTDGKSLGNVRAMHGKVAAGKVTGIDFNDSEKAIDIAVKVVDDNEWKKVLEGVYTGFSMGGRYADGSRKAEKVDGKDITRYTAIPSEISLVDRPCIPTAKFFEVQKADGSLAKVDFKEPAAEVAEPVAKTDAPEQDGGTINGTPEEVDQLVKMMNEQGIDLKAVIAKVAARDDVSASDKKDAKAKYGDVNYADEENKKYPLDTAEHVKAAASYFGMEKNRSKYSEADQKKIDGKIAAAKKKFDVGEEKADFALPLAKGLYTCGSLAGLLAEVEYICRSVEFEAEYEGDGSTIGAELLAWLNDGGKILQAMVAEEVAEATGANQEPVVEVVELSERAAALVKSFEPILAKVGARNSKVDQDRIQKAHDSLVAAGATCAAEKTEPVGELAKGDALSKADLDKVIADAVAPLNKALAEAADKIKKLEEQPAPTTVKLRAVAKGEDVGDTTPDAKPEPVIDDHGEVHEAAGLIKSLHKAGGKPLLKLS